MTYMSVERETIQKAFTKAHRLSQSDNVTADVRRQAKEIASLIWKSCGEAKPLPETLPEEMQEMADGPNATQAQLATFTAEESPELLHRG